jgi:hypothetical protein
VKRAVGLLAPPVLRCMGFFLLPGATLADTGSPGALRCPQTAVLLVSEDVRATQDCRHGSELPLRSPDEGPEIEIGDIYLISMCIEMAPDQCITLSDVSLDVFEPPNTWDLFRKDAMPPGIQSDEPQSQPQRIRAQRPQAARGPGRALSSRKLVGYGGQ